MSTIWNANYCTYLACLLILIIGYSEAESTEKYRVNHVSDSRSCAKQVYLSNRIEYIDICYLDRQNKLQGQLFEAIFKHGYTKDSETMCYRFFQKLPLVNNQLPHPSNSIYNAIYQNGSKLFYELNHVIKQETNKLKPIPQNLGWLSLEQFDVNFCIEPEKYSLTKIVTINRKSMKDQAAGQIKKTLMGKGLHQKANLTLKISNSYDINAQQCSIIVEQILPVSTYIDTDELFSISGNDPIRKQLISVQTPAYLSKQLWYSHEIPFSLWQENGLNTYTYQQPIHFRYPTPLQKQEYQYIKLHPFTSVTISCAGNRQYVVIEDYLVDRGTAEIPVGDKTHQYVISTLTLMSQVMCAAILMKYIKR